MRKSKVKMGQKINPVFKSSTTCNFQAMNIDKLNFEKNCDSEDSQEPMNEKVLVKHFSIATPAKNRKSNKWEKKDSFITPTIHRIRTLIHREEQKSKNTKHDAMIMFQEMLHRKHDCVVEKKKSSKDKLALILNEDSNCVNEKRNHTRRPNRNKKSSNTIESTIQKPTWKLYDNSLNIQVKKKFYKDKCTTLDSRQESKGIYKIDEQEIFSTSEENSIESSKYSSKTRIISPQPCIKVNSNHVMMKHITSNSVFKERICRLQNDWKCNFMK